ncbi:MULTISPECIES: hypothetical protein [Spirulina sp. CCY15215]|uniref:hypothetical protein n=1 Tax=Spirulina sp. CCY15215 TaxID=2767591 RepID=UPI0019508A99|nr:hypothetical protein [Spirulina major]
MKQKLLTIVALLSTVSVLPAFAVEPSLVNYGDRVSWSEVEYSEFDGLYVNDRHTGIGGDRDYFVSQWSQSGIRFTFRDNFVASISIVPRIEYQSRRHYNHRTDEWEDISVPETVNERVENWGYRDYSPTVIHFSINGEQYSYTEGKVSPELANALANAPAKNMKIRLEFSDTPQYDLKPLMEVEIGQKTVLTWRKVFAVSRDRTEVERTINRNSEGDRDGVDMRDSSR